MTENTAPKQRGGFKPGQSGNSSGRPKGSRNKTTLAIEALLEGEAEALARKANERALEGDAAALRLCLDRLALPRRDRPTPFDMPALKEAADARDAFAAIIAAPGVVKRGLSPPLRLPRAPRPTKELIHG